MKYTGRNCKDADLENLTTTYGNRLQTDSIGEMAGILSAIRRKRGITVEELCGETGLGYSRLSSLASMLEADGFITIDLLRRCSISRRTI